MLKRKSVGEIRHWILSDFEAEMSLKSVFEWEYRLVTKQSLREDAEVWVFSVGARHNREYHLQTMFTQ